MDADCIIVTCRLADRRQLKAKWRVIIISRPCMPRMFVCRGARWLWTERSPTFPSLVGFVRSCGLGVIARFCFNDADHRDEVSIELQVWTVLLETKKKKKYSSKHYCPHPNSNHRAAGYVKAPYVKAPYPYPTHPVPHPTEQPSHWPLVVVIQL